MWWTMTTYHYAILLVITLFIAAWLIVLLIRYNEFKHHAYSYFNTGRPLTKKRKTELKNNMESLYLQLNRLDDKKLRKLKFYILSQENDSSGTNAFHVAMGILPIILTTYAIGLSLVSTAFGSISNRLSESELAKIMVDLLAVLSDIMFMLYVIIPCAGGYVLSLCIASSKKYFIQRFIITINQSETDRALRSQPSLAHYIAQPAAASSHLD